LLLAPYGFENPLLHVAAFFAASNTVVESLSELLLYAKPQHLKRNVIQAKSDFFGDYLTTRENGKVRNRALRRSPNPGAGLHNTFSTPRALFSCQCFPSTSSSAMISKADQNGQLSPINQPEWY